MAYTQHIPSLASLEEALTVLFCLVDDAYVLLNPRRHTHESLKKLSDSEVLTLALFQLEGYRERAIFSQRRGLLVRALVSRYRRPSSFLIPPPNAQAQALLGPLRRSLLPELVDDPETLVVDSTFLDVLHPRQVKQPGFPWNEMSRKAFRER